MCFNIKQKGLFFLHGVLCAGLVKIGCMAAKQHRFYHKFTHINSILGEQDAMFKKLKSLLPPAPPAHGEAEKRAMARSAVSRVSNGNVHIQLGNFATKSDINKLKEKVLGSDNE